MGEVPYGLEKGLMCLSDFSLLSMMLAVVLSYTAFIMLRRVPSIATLLRVFLINGC